jgi:hypothetical protein
VNKSPQYESDTVAVNVVFYDTADTSTILHEKTFQFPAHYSTVELLAAVRGEGAEARRSREQVDALLSTIVIDSEGNV